jgi:hypothetical protein
MREVLHALSVVIVPGIRARPPAGTDRTVDHPPRGGILMFCRTLALAAASSLAFAAASSASSPPVGPLPKGPVTTIRTQPGALVAIALPHRSGGLAWRLAGSLPPGVVEVSEANVGADVVVVYRTKGTGTATLAYGLTRDESTGARASLTFKITAG